MYSNDVTQIKQGLVNYIGAILNACPFEGRAARQFTASILIEEALKLAKEEETYDLYVLKPLIRACIILFENRMHEVEKLNNKEAKITAQHYRGMVGSLKHILQSLDKQGGD